MDWDEQKRNYEQYFTIQRVLYAQDRNLLPYMMYLKLDDPTKLQAWFAEETRSLSIDHKEFERTVGKRLAQISKLKHRDATSKETPAERNYRSRVTRSDPIRKFLSKYSEQLLKRIEDIPPSLGKAEFALAQLSRTNERFLNDGLYAAMAYLGNKVDSSLVESINKEWVEDRSDHREQDIHGFSKIFWSPSAGREIENGVARYSFAEVFELGGFESAFDEFIQMAAAGLYEDAVGNLRSQLHDLFLIGFSSKLAIRIGGAIEVTLRRTCCEAKGNHWIEAFDESGKPRRYIPSVATTALAVLALQRHATTESHRKLAIGSAKWLVEQQTPEGAWCIDYSIDGKLVQGPSVYTTIAVMESIVRAELSGIDHALKSAKNWLIAKQNKLGFWQEEGWDAAFGTALVLKCLQFEEAAKHRPTDPYLLAAEGFLHRSLALLQEENPTARRLAVIAAHQGLESFLYGLLIHEHKTIWRTPTETNGMREALKILQEHLKYLKKLKPNETIPYRSHLETLAHLRDEIVHKAADVTQPAVRPLIDATWKFASQLSREILGFTFP